MSFFTRMVFVVFIVLGNLSLFSQATSDIAYKKALHYLEQRNEVYFRFGLLSQSRINHLNGIIFIDRVEGRDIYAYANKQGFETFLEHNLWYEVLTPPSLAGPKPKMSDYDSPGDRLVIDKYPTYEGYLKLMESFANDYPEICKLHEIGESVKKRKLLVLQMSKNVEERECEPKFFHSSTIHGDETAGYMLTLRMAQYLLTNYGKDEQATNLLDSIELWLCPLMNPDGTYNGGNSTVQRAKRTNAKGQDLNRDYPPPPSSGIKQAQYKAQPETNACMAFEKKHNFVMSIDNHGGIEAAFYPWSIKSTKTVDVDWFILVCKQYADLVHEVSGSGHFTGAGGDGVGNWYKDMYKSVGTRPDWQYHYRHCREVTVELSRQKTLSESNFNKWWDYHKNATLTFYRQMFNGIRGTVTDSITGVGLPAKVYIENHDKDSSHVYADLPHGNYYRPIIAGTYSITFSCKDYFPRTISGMQVKNNAATILDVKLLSSITGNKPFSQNLGQNISINVQKRGAIIYLHQAQDISTIAIYALNGTVVKTFSHSPGTPNSRIFWNGLSNSGNKVSPGYYIVKLENNQQTYTKPIILSF